MSFSEETISSSRMLVERSTLSPSYKDTRKALEALGPRSWWELCPTSAVADQWRTQCGFCAPSCIEDVMLQGLAQSELMVHCQGNCLQTSGPLCCAWWYPDEPVLLEVPMVLALAEKYGWSSAQFLLRWLVQQKVTCIPKELPGVWLYL
jgi:alcohol dehydrogenase (NADP+)